MRTSTPSSAAATSLRAASLDGLRERGRAIPDDVAVVGFDNWEIIAAQARPPLTTVDMNLHDLGARRRSGSWPWWTGTPDSGVVHLPCSLVVRESAGNL